MSKEEMTTALAPKETTAPATSTANQNASSLMPFDMLAGEEVIERRDACIKHFDLGMGRYQMIAYPEAVHYEEGGEWKEIDNTLEEAEDGKGRRVLRNRANALNARFAEQGGSGALVELSHNGKELSWTFERPARHAKAHVRQGSDIKREQLLRKARSVGEQSEQQLNSATLSELET